MLQQRLLIGLLFALAIALTGLLGATGCTRFGYPSADAAEVDGPPVIDGRGSDGDVSGPTHDSSSLDGGAER